jgi:hypothetical protein
MPTYTTFRELYDDPTMDPYNGVYDNVLAEFVVKSGWNPEEMLSSIVSMDTDMANAYIGLFSDPHNPVGSTRLLHAPRTFPTRLGQPSPYDYQAFAFIDDVSRGMVQAVQLSETLFESTGAVHLPLTGSHAWEMWTNNQDIELLPSLEKQTERQTTKLSKLMFVPPKFINLFLGKRYTPRQLIEQVYPQLADEEEVSALKPFVNWMMACGTTSGSKTRTYSPCLLPDVQPPIANARFFRWIQDFTDRMLTSTAQTPPSTVDTSQTQLTAIMAQMLQGQQQLQADMTNARAQAATRKSVLIVIANFDHLPSLRCLERGIVAVITEIGQWSW